MNEAFINDDVESVKAFTTAANASSSSLCSWGVLHDDSKQANELFVGICHFSCFLLCFLLHSITERGMICMCSDGCANDIVGNCAHDSHRFAASSSHSR